MMVDISHVSDKTFYDAVEVSKAPVIASHSSVRAISKHPRNMTDDMMRALAKNGGVIMINYAVPFLSEEFRVASEKKSGNIVESMAAMAKKCGGHRTGGLGEGGGVNHQARRESELPKGYWAE